MLLIQRMVVDVHHRPRLVGKGRADPTVADARVDCSALRREPELPAAFPVAAQREADEAARTTRLPRVDRTDLRS
jgi:hypothetical protein